MHGKLQHACKSLGYGRPLSRSVRMEAGCTLALDKHISNQKQFANAQTQQSTHAESEFAKSSTDRSVWQFGSAHTHSRQLFCQLAQQLCRICQRLPDAVLQTQVTSGTCLRFEQGFLTSYCASLVWQQSKERLGEPCGFKCTHTHEIRATGPQLDTD